MKTQFTLLFCSLISASLLGWPKPSFAVEKRNESSTPGTSVKGSPHATDSTDLRGVAKHEVEGKSPDVEQKGELVQFPDFSKIDSETRAAKVEKKGKVTCHRNGQTYEASDAMFSSCMAENEVQRSQGRSSGGKNSGAPNGGATSMTESF